MPKSGRVFFLSKVNIWNLNCARATAFIFDTRADVLEVFQTENVSTWGWLEPPIFGFVPNALTYWAIRARHLLSHLFEYWLWRCWHFLSKVIIWSLEESFLSKFIIWYGKCARATALIFDLRTGVLVKVSKFLRQKMARPEGGSNPQPSLSLTSETNCSPY